MACRGEAVCKVVRQYGNVCFYGVGQYVQTGIGGYTCRNCHGKAGSTIEMVGVSGSSRQSDIFCRRR